MKVTMTRKIVAEIGDYPLEKFQELVAETDRGSENDVEKIGFDDDGVLVVYSVIKVESEIVAIPEVSDQP
jgi:hypothetical protein